MSGENTGSAVRPSSNKCFTRKLFQLLVVPGKWPIHFYSTPVFNMFIVMKNSKYKDSGFFIIFFNVFSYYLASSFKIWVGGKKVHTLMRGSHVEYILVTFSRKDIICNLGI